MVFKVLIGILALLVLESNAQYLNRIPLDGMDLYRLEFSKDHDRRKKVLEVDTIHKGTTAKPCDGWKGCNKGAPPKNGTHIIAEKREDIKNAIRAFEERLELMNLLRSLPREEVSDPVIFVPEEYDYKMEK